MKCTLIFLDTSNVPSIYNNKLLMYIQFSHVIMREDLGAVRLIIEINVEGKSGRLKMRLNVI